MANKKKKGFTLTELIVVIVIIGILAAVLIPSVTGYIQKAKRSNDVQLASEMSKNIQYYCIENDVDQDKLLGTDIRTIALFRGFDLKPRTNKWTFVYNIANKKVEVKDFPLFEGDGTNVKTSMPAEPIDPTNYDTGYYLLGKGKSNFEQAVDKLCNLKNKADYDSAISLLESGSNAYEHIDKFNPNKTLYVSNSALTYTEAIVLNEGSYSSNNIQRIVYLEKTVSLPKNIYFGIDGSQIILSDSAKKCKSSLIKTMEIDSDFKPMYPNVSEIDAANLEEVKLKYVFDTRDEDTYRVQYVVDEKLLKAKSVLIESIPYGDATKYVDQETQDVYLIETCKWIATFYDENGAFARGEQIVFNKSLFEKGTTPAPSN